MFVVFPAGVPTLDHELYKSIKPGLSAYTDEPEQVQLLLSPPHEAPAPHQLSYNKGLKQDQTYVINMDIYMIYYCPPPNLSFQFESEISSCKN